MKNKIIIAFVGMAGSGKSEAVKYIAGKNISSIRFGDATDEGLREQGLELTEVNERAFREALRKELGMAAYAIKAEPKIQELLKTQNVIVLDGLYSWEEYVYLIEKFPSLIVVQVYTQREIRYQRLATRAVRPLASKEAKARDVAEIQELHKGGPIAIADYLLTNNTTMEEFMKQINELLMKLQIANGE